MRVALLVVLALTFGGVFVATAPSATACTSDPAIVCAVIHALDECQVDLESATGTVKRCLR